MRDILLLVLTGSLSVAALVRPVLGILAYFVYSFAGPHSYTWGIARTFPHAQTLAIFTLIGYMIWPEPKRFPRQREFAMLLALWGVFGISTLFALFPDRAFDHFVHMSKIFLMLVVCTSLINTEERLHLLVKIIALSIGFYGFKGGLFVLLTGGVYPIEGPINTYLEANNAIGMALVMNVPLLFYLAKLEANWWLRRLMWAMLAGSYPAVAGTFSRGAWVGLAIVTMLLVAKHKGLGLKFLPVLVLVIASLIIIPQFASEQLADRFDTFSNIEGDQSAQSRFWNWTFCSKVALQFPITGAGFDYYSLESYARFYPEFLERFPGKVWSCHNVWLTILGELGFLGFAVWLGLMTSCWLSFRELRRYGQTHPESKWMVSYAEMLKFSFVAYIICGTFLDIAYFELYYLLIVVVVIMKEKMRLATIGGRDIPIGTVAPTDPLAASSPIPVVTGQN